MSVQWPYSNLAESNVGETQAGGERFDWHDRPHLPCTLNNGGTIDHHPYSRGVQATVDAEVDRLALRSLVLRWAAGDLTEQDVHETAEALWEGESWPNYGDTDD